MNKKSTFFILFLIPYFCFSGVAVAQKKTVKPVEKLAAASTQVMFGLENSVTGNHITEPTFTDLRAMDDGYWCATQNGKQGILDSNGRWIVQPLYTSIAQYKDGKIVTAEKVSTTDSRFETSSSQLQDISADSISVYGVVDVNGNRIVQARYRYLEIGDGNTYLILGGNGLYGFLDSKGDVLIEPTFEYATVFHGNIAVVSEGGMRQERSYEDYIFSARYRLYSGGSWRIIGKEGKEVSTTVYDYIRVFSDGRAAFNKGGKWRKRNYSDEFILSGGLWGYIDENGTEVIPAKYSFAYDFSNGKAKVRNDKELKWITPAGELTTPGEARTSTIRTYCIQSRSGFIDEKGDWKIMPMFHAAGRFSEGLACVQPLLPVDSRCRATRAVTGYDLLDVDYDINPLNDYEEVLLESAYFDMTNELDSARWVKRYWGYSDANGKMIIPARFDYAMPFSNGRAYVSYRDKWGVIDRTGKWIFAPLMDTPWRLQSYLEQYMTGNVVQQANPWYSANNSYEESMSNLFSFNEGVGLVYYKQKFGYIDTNGKVIAAPVYDEALVFAYGRGAVAHNNNWGFVNKQGKEIIALKYSSVRAFGPNGLACVSVLKPANAGTQNGSDGEEGVEVVVEVSEAESYNYYDENLYGFIDTAGSIVINAAYRYAKDFHEGLDVVTDRNGKKGYINENGKYVIQPKYRTASDFHNGYAMISEGYEQGHFINKTGADAPQYSFKKMPPSDKMLLPFRGENQLMGYGYQSGTWIIEPKFESASQFYSVH